MFLNQACSPLCLWKRFKPRLPPPPQTTIQHCHVSLTCWGEPGSWKTFLDFLIWQKNIFHVPSLTRASTTAKGIICGKTGSLPPQPACMPQSAGGGCHRPCVCCSGIQDSPMTLCSTSTKLGRTTTGVRMLFTPWLKSTWTPTTTRWEGRCLRTWTATQGEWRDRLSWCSSSFRKCSRQLFKQVCGYF